MKRLTQILVLGALIGALQALSSCSSPLSSSRIPGPNPIPQDSNLVVDTVVLIDTVIQIDTLLLFDSTLRIDTVIQLDTLIQYDTVNQTDTVMIVDTVIRFDTTNNRDTITQVDTISVVDTVIVVDTVYVTDTLVVIDTVVVTIPDTTGGGGYCGRLSSSRKEIVWLLQNDAGMYELDFAALVSSDRPPKKLEISVNGDVYVWQPGKDPALALELDLGENTVIRITPFSPASFGHSVDICLTVTAL